jgi:hypothetical protein
MYDRAETEWAALEAAGWDFLRDRARKPRPITSYAEMSAVLARRTGQPPWDFELQADRAAMGEPLGPLADRSFAETKKRPGGGLMISALYMYLDQNDVGPGFTVRPQGWAHPVCAPVVRCQGHVLDRPAEGRAGVGRRPLSEHGLPLWQQTSLTTARRLMSTPRADSFL